MKLKLVDILAERLHEGQMRKDGKTPYITHPRAVAKAVLDNGNTDETIIAAALLHDVIEDCGITPQLLFEELISGCACDPLEATTIVSIVMQLTSPDKALMQKGSSAFGRKTRKQMMCSQFKTAGHQALIVKLYDRIHNLSDVDSMNDPQFKAKYLIESEELLKVLRSQLAALADATNCLQCDIALKALTRP